MQLRHIDRSLYFQEQEQTTRQFVIPYISDFITFDKHTVVLEIGCGEGGNLSPFLDLGCTCIGIDLSEDKIKKAHAFYEGHPAIGRISFFAEDIYSFDAGSIPKADLIMMRDVIEHIPNQERFMEILPVFLKPEGAIFFGFPPWQMPFGGHQQTCANKLAAILPWFHLFPMPVYRMLLRIFGESEANIHALSEIKETGISIERFRKALEKNKLKKLKETLFLINPNYSIKFNLKPRRQFRLIERIPYLRNFFTTCCYCVVRLE